MGRAEKRRIERQSRIENRKGKIPLSHSEISEIERSARQETSKYNVEALMSCFALAEHRLYGFGQKRIMRSLQYIDNLMGAILNDEATMEDYLKELENEAGVVIRCDD